ncbi:MAG: hypothetical protein QGG02_02995 [Gammaproteobacteria bacterium]|nr:hypothetical protein [Gammaproteobacteria bacterium]
MVRETKLSTISYKLQNFYGGKDGTSYRHQHTVQLCVNAVISVLDSRANNCDSYSGSNYCYKQFLKRRITMANKRLKILLTLITLGLSSFVSASPAVYDPATGELNVPVIRAAGATDASDDAYQAIFTEMPLGSLSFGCPDVFGPSVQPISDGDAIYDPTTNQITLPELVLQGTSTPLYRVILDVDLANCIITVAAGELISSSYTVATSVNPGVLETGNVGSEWLTGLYTSIAVASDGTVHISYYDHDGSVTPAPGQLKHAWRSGIGTNWNTEVVEAPPSGVFGTMVGSVGSTGTSMAIEDDGTLHIVYTGNHDSDVLTDFLKIRLKHAWKKPGLSWQTQLVDCGICATPGAYNFVWQPSLDIDNNGNLHVSAYFTGPTSPGDDSVSPDEPGLGYVYTMGGGGYSWSAIDIVKSGAAYGQQSSLKVAPSGKIHIAYLHHEDDSDYINLMHAWKPPSMGWSSEYIENSRLEKRMFPSLDVAEDESVYIAYYDVDNGELKVAAMTPPGSSPPYNGVWSTETVDGTDPSEMAGQHTALIVASDGTIHIAYSQNNFQDVLLASYPLNGGAWTIQPVASFGNLGMYNSLAEGPSGILHIAYHDMVLGDLLHIGLSP